MLILDQLYYDDIGTTTWAWGYQCVLTYANDAHVYMQIKSKNYSDVNQTTQTTVSACNDVKIYSVTVYNTVICSEQHVPQIHFIAFTELFSSFFCMLNKCFEHTVHKCYLLIEFYEFIIVGHNIFLFLFSLIYLFVYFCCLHITALLVTRSKYDTAATAVIMINTEAEN